MTSEKGLGRGLGALLGDFSAPRETAPAAAPGKVALQRIEPNPDQPRRNFDPEELDALAESIRQNGILQPLAVRPLGDGRYQIIAGERRWRAARIAGLTELPVHILEPEQDQITVLSLIENLQRQNLDPMEEAAGYRRLMDEYGFTQETVADRVTKSRSAVANTLRLLTLPKELQAMVSAGKLTPGHARAVLTLPTEKQQITAAQKIAALQLSVRQAELMCKTMLRKPEEAPVKDPLAVDYVAECEKTLTKHLGRKVRIVCGKKKGRFEVEFYGEDDLNDLYAALQNLPARAKGAKKK